MAEFMQPGQIFIGEPYKDRIAEEFFKGQQAATELTKAEEAMRIAQIQREQEQQRIGLEAKRVGLQGRSVSLAERQAAQAQAENAAFLKGIRALGAQQDAIARERAQIGQEPSVGLTPPTQYNYMEPTAPPPAMAAPSGVPGVAVTPPTVPAPSRQVLGVAETVSPTETVTPLPSPRMEMVPSAPPTFGISGAPVEAAAPTFTTVDPTRSAAMQALQRGQRTADINTFTGEVVKNIAANEMADPVRSTISSIYGYFTRTPEAEAIVAGRRADAAKAMNWFRSQEARTIIDQSPNLAAEAQRDPVGFYKRMAAKTPADMTKAVTANAKVAAATEIAQSAPGGPNEAVAAELSRSNQYIETLYKGNRPTSMAQPQFASRDIRYAELAARENKLLFDAAAVFARKSPQQAATMISTALENASKIRAAHDNARLAYTMEYGRSGNLGPLSQEYTRNTGVPTTFVAAPGGQVQEYRNGVLSKVHANYDALVSDIRLATDAAYRAEEAKSRAETAKELARAKREITVEMAKRGSKVEQLKTGDGFLVTAPDGSTTVYMANPDKKTREKQPYVPVQIR